MEPDATLGVAPGDFRVGEFLKIQYGYGCSKIKGSRECFVSHLIDLLDEGDTDQEEAQAEEDGCDEQGSQIA